MYQILEKRRLSSNVVLLVIDAPYVAKKAEPGQFIILRVDADGERIPLTISAYDRKKGTITIVVQEVGATTMKLGQMNQGDCLHDFVGPLGKASEFDGIKKAAVVGGGLGCAIALPQAQKLHDMGVDVDLIAGFRNTDAIILADEMKDACSRLTLVTDDGSNGHKGFVTDALKELIEAGNKYDVVIAIGPMIMMKFVCKTTEPYGIKTIVSINNIMVDGTGMCGGCRLTVGGETKFACVDGPDVDGHQVDFDEAMRRSAIYKPQEQAAREHQCNLMKMEVK